MFFAIEFLRLNFLQSKYLTQRNEEFHAVSRVKPLFSKALVNIEGEKLGGQANKVT